MRLPVVFLDSDTAPRILGRSGIFDQFLVVFEERNRRSGFVASGTKEEKIIQTTLDQIS